MTSDRRGGLGGRLLRAFATVVAMAKGNGSGSCKGGASIQLNFLALLSDLAWRALKFALDQVAHADFENVSKISRDVHLDYLHFIYLQTKCLWILQHSLNFSNQ